MSKLYLLVELNDQGAEEAQNIAADIEDIFDLTGARGGIHGPFTCDDIQFQDAPVDAEEEEEVS